MIKTETPEENGGEGCIFFETGRRSRPPSPGERLSLKKACSKVRPAEEGSSGEITDEEPTFNEFSFFEDKKSPKKPSILQVLTNR